MKKVGIVVQRCHENIVGGSESLAWQYACLLRDAYEVEVITTTAIETAKWENFLPVGSEVREGIHIRRFPVTIGRTRSWSKLHQRILQDFIAFDAGRQKPFQTRFLPWSTALQEEFIRTQGPYSEPLNEFLQDHGPDYRIIIFVTYLYPPTYFGLLQVPRRTALFAPTLHNEQTAYLRAFKYAAHRARGIIWLTDAERRLGHDLWGELPGRIVSMSIDAKLRPARKERHPFLLYAGRIDPNKGCNELFEYFIRFKQDYHSNLKLILVGKDDILVPAHPDIEFRGFVSAEEKFGLMRGAVALAMPSRNESFSIVTLEAMGQETPVLADAASDVIVDHVKLSGAGIAYENYEGFARAVSEMLEDKVRLAEMGARGREYVLAKYQRDTIREDLINAVEADWEPSLYVAEPAEEKEEGSAEHPLSDAVAAKEARSETVSQQETILVPVVQSERKEVGELVEELGPREPISLPSNGEQNGLFNSPPLPLPEGWSEEDLRQFLNSVQVEDGPLLELFNYANRDFRRFAYTLDLVPNKPNQVILELGANPYFTTVLLHKFRDATLHLCNFFDQPGHQGVQEITIHKTGEVIPFQYRQFNIETDTFPYDDGTFDVVLFCEIIEHLLSDPVHPLNEIKRVLKPNGTLVSTTPNATRLENVCKTLAGVNIFDAYSGYGPYGRHNREYTKHDLYRLLSANGFQVVTLITADVNEDFAVSYENLGKLGPLLEHRQPDLGQYIFCQSTLAPGGKIAPPVRPDWLFRSLG